VIVPEEVARLTEERERARSARDFASADTLRDRIRAAGFEVTDTPDGPRLQPVAALPSPRIAPAEVVSLLDEPGAADATLQWLVEGWAEDVRRGIESFDRHHPDMRLQHVVVDVSSNGSGDWGSADVLLLRRETGWGAARNAGLTRSLGDLVVLLDGSVEAAGDVLGPIKRTLGDPSVGVTGPFGIVTEDLREFHESDGPDVDAIEGYLMAFRREQVREGLAFDERFKFYRSADIDLSFRIKDQGLRAVVTRVPVTRHEHRMWANTPPDRRDALSKRNYYRFLERFRGRLDLTVSGGRPTQGG
jgi:cysteinyl-tRNA synthetase